MTETTQAGASAKYDDMAEKFYAETHVMAPGKDIAAAMGGYDEFELRMKLFRMWQEKNTLRAELDTALRHLGTLKAAGAMELKEQRDALIRAIDDQMVTTHLGVFNVGDDAKKAINDLMVWSQGVGEFFEREKYKAELNAANAQRDEAVASENEMQTEYAIVSEQRDMASANYEAEFRSHERTQARMRVRLLHETDERLTEADATIARLEGELAAISISETTDTPLASTSRQAEQMTQERAK